MTDSIWELECAVESAKAMELEARENLRSATLRTQEMEKRLAEAKMKKLGFVVLETRVDYKSWKWAGPFLIKSITRNGSLILCKIKNDGTPSNAGSGVYSAVSVDDIRHHQTA
jgi:hypothetical protein